MSRPAALGAGSRIGGRDHGRLRLCKNLNGKRGGL